jgi:hypothetical protein
MHSERNSKSTRNLTCPILIGGEVGIGGESVLGNTRGSV